MENIVMAFGLVVIKMEQTVRVGATIRILHLPIDPLRHAYKFHHPPGVSKPRYPVPMATHKVFSVVFFVLLGLGICSATIALFTYEGGSGGADCGGVGGEVVGTGSGLELLVLVTLDTEVVEMVKMVAMRLKLEDRVIRYIS
ncbi:hypothetical protein Pint_03442 [Pistacia integerrima]|uniref:Uncharacterized protein n=1 Tax=Pistacia integerrima TaxID=434235 RepID=A0ACC0ZJ29_9ROSI|nr:hypothetical protein Pint_03442 [Pistacia integerrima]